MSFSDEPDLIVLRAPDIGHFPLDGVWFDLRKMPPRPAEGPFIASFMSPTGDAYHAVPTNEFEVRSDGSVAEIWVVHLAE